MRACVGPEGSQEVTPAASLARGGVDCVFGDLGAASTYVLEEGAPDLREAPDLGCDDVAFFLGGPAGLDDETRARLAAAGARPLAVGPVGLHAEDVIAIVSNELDRREVRET